MRADRVGVRGIFRRLEAHRDMAHCRKIIDFVRLDLLDDADQVGAVGQVTIMKNEALIIDMGVLVEVVDAIGRSEEHTSELQSLMRITNAVFCLKNKTERRQM